MTLQARDLECLAHFYGRTLGCAEISRGPDRMWLVCGEHSRLGIWSPGPKEFGDRAGAHVRFALSCAHPERRGIRRRLASLGVPHPRAIEHEGGDRSIYVETRGANVVDLGLLSSARGKRARGRRVAMSS